MPDLFTVSTAESIRTAILSSLRTRYLALGKDIDTSVDSDAFNLADAYSIALEDIEARALALVSEIFPDTASDTYLAKHGDLIGLPRKAATSSVLTILATGIATSAWATSDLLVSPSGVTYQPTAPGSIGGGGTASLNVQAVTTGTITNQNTGTLLTWVSPPSGIDTVATITAVVTVASDDETTEDYAARIIEWWQERPGAGNRSDWVQWAESRSGVEQAYVYPLDHPSLGTATLGCVIVSILGDPAQRSVSAPLGVSSGNSDDVLAYILGTGVYAADGGQLPAFMAAADVTIEVPALTYVNVTSTVVLGTGYTFPFAGTFTKAVSGSNTTSRIYLTANPVGTIHVGDLVAVDTRVGADHGQERGAYQVRTVTAVHHTADYIDLDSPLGTIPDDGNLVRPAPANWLAMRDAMLAVFDRLGPGDESEPRSARWPVSTTVGPYTLYRAALQAACMSLPGLAGAPAGVAGVVSLTVTSPGSDQVATARHMLVPGAIVFTA